MTTLFGIPNCDTVKKARVWLDKHNIEHHFHDFRKDGLEKTQAQKWLDALGAEKVVNKRSTTWKQLSDAEKEQALSGDSAALLIQYPTLIKRPVLETGSKTTNSNVSVGFKPDQYQSIFS